MQLKELSSRYLPEVAKNQIRQVRKLLLGPRLLTSGLRTLPDFLILGAQKAGTTSLFEYLVQHRQIAPSFRKEVHYFDRNYPKGPSWYRAFFPRRRQIEARTRIHGRYLCGEATPYYLFHPEVPRRVRRLLPEAKFLILLRNPIDRAYSHYYHAVTRGHETCSFEEAIEREPSRMAGELEMLTRDESYISEPHVKLSYFSRGCYIDQLRRWLEHFPMEAFFIASAEEFSENPQAVCGSIERFLGLSQQTLKTSRRHNTNRYAPMSKEYRIELARRYREQNQELYDLLGRDLGWDR